MQRFCFLQNEIMKKSLIVLLIVSIALFPALSLIAAADDGALSSQNSFSNALIQEQRKQEEKENDAATEQRKQEEEALQEAQDLYDAKEEEYKKANASVSAINGQITDLETEIIDTIEEIEQLQINIVAKQQEIDEMYNGFKGRLKSIYMSGSFTDVQALLTSDSFIDYLTRSEMIRVVSAKDAAAIKQMQKAYQELKEQQELIKNDRIKLELKEADLQTSKAGLEMKKAEAAKAYNESIELLKEVDEAAEATKVQIEQEQKELKKIIQMCEKEAAISSDIAKAIKNGQYDDVESEIISNGGSICFPVPACKDVSCGFYGYTNHNGMDFANMKVNGQKVVAAKDGKIMNVQLLDYSYGHHVWINHGDNVATLYAHMSRIVVKEGQYVKQGQVIGYVGSTGNSTGPHLHFGLLIDGQFVNPIHYF